MEYANLDIHIKVLHKVVCRFVRQIKFYLKVYVFAKMDFIELMEYVVSVHQVMHIIQLHQYVNQFVLVIKHIHKLVWLVYVFQDIIELMVYVVNVKHIKFMMQVFKNVLGNANYFKFTLKIFINVFALQVIIKFMESVVNVKMEQPMTQFLNFVFQLQHA